MPRTLSRSRTANQRTACAVLLACGAVSVSTEARADNCAKPDLEAAFPGDGATDVPVNATLSAVYAESADYLGETVTLTAQGADVAVDARFDSAERRLIIDKPALTANTTYTLTWPALRGLTTAGHGLGKSVTFSTGERDDLAAPSFDGITSLTWDLVHPRDSCTDDLEARLRFRLGFGRANDDGGRDGLSLLLFQASGPTLLDGAPRFVAARPLPVEEYTDVDLSTNDAGSRICFALLVRDLVGNVSATGSDTRCVKTTAPPIFYGCGFKSSPRGPFDLLGVVMLAALCGLCRRRAP